MAVSMFQYLKGIGYRGKDAPNILSRVQIPQSVLNDSKLFHNYVIEDGDRPDTIAAYYYGSDYYDWIVLLSNNIIDLANEWPLTQPQFDDYIIFKYGSHADSMSEIVGYRVNTNKDPIPAADYDALDSSEKKYWSRKSVSDSPYYYITPNQISINAESLDALPGEEQDYWTAITAFDVEFETNEAKRTIQLVDAQAVPSIERSLRSLSSNG